MSAGEVTRGRVSAAALKCPLTSPHKDCVAVTYRQYGVEYTQVWPSESDAKTSLRHQGVEKNIVKVVRVHGEAAVENCCLITGHPCQFRYSQCGCLCRNCAVWGQENGEVECPF